MRRFCQLLASVILLCTSGASTSAAQDRTIIWVGKHTYQNSDYIDQISSHFERFVTFLPVRLELFDPVRSWLQDLEVKTNSGTGYSRAELKTHFRTSLESLIALSGSGVSNPESIVSLVYLGPANVTFEADFAELRILSINTQPAAEQYLYLLLLYAMIKASHESQLNFQQVIGPLREQAFEFVSEARAAQPEIVDMIESDLISLVP